MHLELCRCVHGENLFLDHLGCELSTISVIIDSDYLSSIVIGALQITTVNAPHISAKYITLFLQRSKLRLRQVKLFVT